MTLSKHPAAPTRFVDYYYYSYSYSYSYSYYYYYYYYYSYYSYSYSYYYYTTPTPLPRRRCLSTTCRKFVLRGKHRAWVEISPRR